MDTDLTLYQVLLYPQNPTMTPTGFDGTGFILYKLKPIAQVPPELVLVTVLAMIGGRYPQIWANFKLPPSPPVLTPQPVPIRTLSMRCQPYNEPMPDPRVVGMVAGAVLTIGLGADFGVAALDAALVAE